MHKHYHEKATATIADHVYLTEKCSQEDFSKSFAEYVKISNQVYEASILLTMQTGKERENDKLFS